MRALLILLFINCCSSLLAQQVVATAGSTFSNTNCSISYTIGEGVAQTLSNGDKTITQGFHQTIISVSVIGELKDPDHAIIVFPNPTSEELTLKLKKEDVTGLQYLLFDMNGKLVIQKTLKSPETKVNVNELSEGFYILKVQAGSKKLKSFKIIKN